MKYCNIFFLFILILVQSVFSQNKSKKEIEKILIDAGNAFYNLDVDKSLNFSKVALNYAHKIKDDELMAKAYNLIGLNIEEFYNPEKGLKYYQKALFHANLTSNDSIKDWVNNNIGSYYSFRTVNHKKSIEFYKKGLYYAEKIKDSTEIMFTKLNIASAYFATNDFKNGLNYIKSTEKFILNNNELEAKLNLYSLYGIYYSYINENSEAELNYTKAIEIGKRNKLDLLNFNIIEVYKDFSKHYVKNNNYEKAYYYLNLSTNLKEKVYDEERTKKVKLAGSQIELDEYQRQISKIENEKQEQSQDLKQSKLIVFLFVIIFFILLLLLYLLNKNNKFRDQTNKELQIANQKLIAAKDKAEEASQLKSQFVSTISHELRTPLYGVVGITNIILEEHKELADSPHLNSLKFSARYLLSLVNDLLQINKIEENKILLENKIFNLSDEIKIIIESLEFIAVKNKNKLILEIDDAIPEFLIGDKLRLSQILINLVSNALKFTKQGSVKVIAKQDRKEGTKQFIYFSVSDTGVGIAKDDQKKIFEKFIQIERKEGDYQGTGLGLSIVEKLIGLFGSKIVMNSEIGVGTTFSFTIAFEADENKKNELLNTIFIDILPNQIYKILVVEDNKINQMITRKILESNNFQCTITDDGYAALNQLDQQSFDIILMDINMPIINGFETSKLIREKGFDIPIIALTAFDEVEIAEQVHASGMNDIIIKPFEQAKLFQVIQSHITKKNVD